MMRAHTKTASGLITLLAVALLIGFAFGRLSSGENGARAAMSVAAADQTPDIAATGTRTSELAELDRLRTKVAGTPAAVVCTPPATNTPEPSPTPTAVPTLVPPAAAGESLAYSGDWTVAVDDVSLMSNFSDLTPQGIYAKVNLTITNNTGVQRRFPYEELVLRDGQGRVFVPDARVKSLNEAGWFTPFVPFLPSEGFVIFDIATDTAGPFILESTVDPTFRVLIELENRG
jgi:hypothetical protein